MIKQVFSDIKNILKQTFLKASEDDIITQGAAIAFYTIFSIAPLFILIISLGGIFMSEEIINQQVQHYLSDFLDEEMVENLNQFMFDRTRGSAGLFTSILALGTVIFGATTVISQLKTALNRIWNVSEIKIHSVWNFIFNRVLSFGMIIVFSLLLISSLAAEAVIGLLVQFFSEIFPTTDFGLYLYASQFSTLIFAIAFFTLIFKILPDVHARWTDVLIGALVTTLLFLLGKYLIGIYLSATGIEATYRAAGSLVIFIIWVYYNVQTILLGAVFTQVYTEKFGGKILPYRFVRLKDMISGEPPGKD